MPNYDFNRFFEPEMKYINEKDVDRFKGKVVENYYWWPK